MGWIIVLAVTWALVTVGIVWRIGDLTNQIEQLRTEVRELRGTGNQTAGGSTTWQVYPPKDPA